MDQLIVQGDWKSIRNLNHRRNKKSFYARCAKVVYQEGKDHKPKECSAKVSTLFVRPTSKATGIFSWVVILLNQYGEREDFGVELRA